MYYFLSTQYINRFQFMQDQYWHAMGTYYKYLKQVKVRNLPK